MIDLPLSVMAWLSVVIVQAVVHFIVLGARQGRAVVPSEEEPMLQECLSMATDDAADENDTSFMLQDSGYECTVSSADPSTPIIFREKETIIPDADLLLELLDQTGTDIFKVSEGKREKKKLK